MAKTRYNCNDRLYRRHLNFLKATVIRLVVHDIFRLVRTCFLKGWKPLITRSSLEIRIKRHQFHPYYWICYLAQPADLPFPLSIESPPIFPPSLFLPIHPIGIKHRTYKKSIARQNRQPVNWSELDHNRSSRKRKNGNNKENDHIVQEWMTQEKE